MKKLKAIRVKMLKAMKLEIKTNNILRMLISKSMRRSKSGYISEEEQIVEHGI